MNIKIGFIKEYTEENSGLNGNFWALGQLSFPYSEDNPTQFTDAKFAKQDLHLYKDVNYYLAGKQSLGIKQAITIPYQFIELNDAGLYDKIFERIKFNGSNDFFLDADVFEIEIPIITSQNQATNP